jgi:hypothetical protein
VLQLTSVFLSMGFFSRGGNMDSDFEIVNPQEMREEMLLQLLAVFVRRFGGEVIVTAHEFGMVEGLEIVAQQTTTEHLKLRIDEGETYIFEAEES